MTLSLAALAAVCAVNAPRARCALPAVDGRRVAVGGAALTLAALVPAAALADPFLDALGVVAATVRMATGVLLLLTGALALTTPPPAAEPALPGVRAALVPVAFPTLCTPGLAVLTVSTSADHSAPIALGVAALALLSLPALTLVAPRPGGSSRPVVLEGLARFVAGLLVLAGIGLLMDGVFDV